MRMIDAEKYMKLLKEQYLHHKSMGNSQAAKAWQGAMQLLYDMPTLTPPNEWRGVEEGLPEIYLDEEGNNIPFLVCGPDSKYPFRALFIGNSWFNGWDPVEVTHWMPLPAPPNRRPSEVAP